MGNICRVSCEAIEGTFKESPQIGGEVKRRQIADVSVWWKETHTGRCYVGASLCFFLAPKVQHKQCMSIVGFGVSDPERVWVANPQRPSRARQSWSVVA